MLAAALALVVILIVRPGVRAAEQSSPGGAQAAIREG
jgi:hypothetical protein